MKLAPTAGTPTAGSIDKQLDDTETAAEAVSAKLSSAPYIAGSQNADGSISVDAGNITIDIPPVQPYSSSAPQRTKGTRLTLFENEFGFWVQVTSYEADRTALNLTGLTLELKIETNDGTTLATLDEGSGILEKVTAASGIWRFKATAAMCPSVVENDDAHWWQLSDVTGGTISEVLAWGRVWVQRRAGF